MPMSRKIVRKRQLAQILEHQGKIDLDLDQDKLARLRADEEEQFWAGQGESRLETFDRKTARSHKAAWD
jgi:tRNA uridine 5-carbamoylmethylation protein Kti12